ncbi:MAG: hypothetical protein LBT75_05010 [Bacilli bacterium]|jgi:leucine dehydrogenase|nr:hypothetical protein [Bacilli bacterium]
MKALENITKMDHEMVSYCFDKETGLKAIIAVHNTKLGPAIGGTRFYDYKTEDDALYDVLRLSRGMTFKNSVGGLHAGGGKAVIIGDPKTLKTPALLRKYGSFVNRLNGSYYTAEDMNISEEDVVYINEGTEYVVGKKEISGNPSPFTALGTYMGIKASAKEGFGSDSLKGLTIAMSGVGAVGYPLAEMLHKEGAKLIVADTNTVATERAAKELGATVVGVNDIYTVECDIFAPCAMGAIISKENAKDYKCKVIAGCANNVLVDDEAGEELYKLGIVYAPDYVINGGGVISCGYEIEPGGWDKDKVTNLVENIYYTLENIYKTSRETNTPTYKVADALAMDRINKEGK